MSEKPRVMDVGQCNPDHNSIRYLIESLGARVRKVALPADALEILRNETYDLVLVNRKIDQDFSDGVDLVRMIKSDPATRAIPVILISNLPEAQAQSVRLGGEPGFGKGELHRSETRELLRKYI